MTTVETGKALVLERRMARTATAIKISMIISIAVEVGIEPSTPLDLRVFRSAYSHDL